MSLDDCIGRSLAGNPALQASARRREAALERAGQARARPNPQFEAEVENVAGGGDYKGWEAAESTLRFSQEIELGGKRAARGEEADEEAAVAQADHDVLKLDLIRDTRQAFGAVLLARGKGRLSDDAVRLAEEVENATAARVSAGKTNPLESDRVLVERARAELARDDAGREFAYARQALEALWGATGSLEWTPSGEAGPLEVPPLDRLLAAVGSTPDSERAEAVVRSARARLGVEESARIPTVEVSAGLKRFEDTGDAAFVAGFAVELPLFNRNARGIRAAAAELDAARLEAAANRAALALELRRLHARLVNQKKRIEILGNTALPAAERALAGAQAGYREGKFGILDVLDAQRVYTELRAEQAEALAELQSLLADVDRLVSPHPTVSGNHS
jgi:cobalt-zinc-cadmium efflux system outer membrane protein